MGGEFIPTLEEGDFALHQILPPGSSLQQSVEVSEKIQRVLLDNFPEIITIVSKIGTAEIATDPMPIEVGDIMVRMKPKEEWLTAHSKDEMFEKMAVVLSDIPGVEYEFTQPIQMRFNELIAGVREDIAIKIFGENPDVLHEKAKEVERLIKSIEGVGDLRVEQTIGLPQMIVHYERNKIAQYGLNIRDLNRTLRTAFAGEVAGHRKHSKFVCDAAQWEANSIEGSRDHRAARRSDADFTRRRQTQDRDWSKHSESRHRIAGERNPNHAGQATRIASWLLLGLWRSV
jgi:heavy metal efflux system protein